MDSPQMPKILVTGGTGLVGSAIKYIVDHEPTEFTKKYDWDFVGSAESDLRQKEASYRLLRRYKPTYVIHLAAKVGGLFANMRNRVDFLRDNIRINENIIEKIATKIVKLCPCEKVGGVTLFFSSSNDSLKYVIIPVIYIFISTG